MENAHENLPGFMQECCHLLAAQCNQRSDAVLEDCPCLQSIRFALWLPYKYRFCERALGFDKVILFFCFCEATFYTTCKDKIYVIPTVIIRPCSNLENNTKRRVTRLFTAVKVCKSSFPRIL